MASPLPPINTLSLAHSGASPTTLVADDTANLFKAIKGDITADIDSAVTASEVANAASVRGKHMIEDAPEVTGMHDRLRLKKDGDQTVAAAEASGVVSKNWMDLKREELQAYEYLCHLGEAKEWMERMIGEKINEEIASLDEACQRGIVLAKLAKSFCPQLVGKIFMGEKLQYRHTDNINYLFSAMREIGLPELFIFELIDCYDKKNIPKVIYAIHALSHFLAKRGMGPKIRDLRGHLSFTEDELRAEKLKMDEAGLPMPSFGTLESSLAKEMKAEEKWLLRYESQVSEITRIQAVWRGKLARRDFQTQLAAHRAEQQRLARIAEEERLARLEQERRRAMEREAAERERAHRIAKMQSEAIKRQRETAASIIQGWYRSSREQELEAMRTLSNPSLSTVRKFLHLADSTNADFVEEAELEELKNEVIRTIRLNTSNESEIKDLEVKISLLIRNKVTLEEVVRTTTKQYRDMKQADAPVTDIFTAKTLDKDSRQKLEGYQSLFYLLQTQPVYLGKLMFLLNRKWGSAFNKFVEGVVMALFGYAQQAREEYMLLQLIKTAIQFEVKDAKEINEIAKSQPFSVRLLMYYARSHGQRKYLQDTLKPLIQGVLDAKELDLDTDVISIYRASIRDEEMRTGQKSARPFNVTTKEAMSDADTKTRYMNHLKDLQNMTAKFLDRIMQSLEDLPYGIRYIVSELRRQLEAKFPAQDAEIDAALGNMLYYRYINPAIFSPEDFDIVSGSIDNTQRKNLGEIGKLLHAVQVGHLSSQDQGLLPLDNFVETSGERFRNFVDAACNVMTPEEHFQIDEYQDLTARPTIMISASEIYQVHAMLIENVEDLVPNRKDALSVVLQELGPAPTIGSSAEQDRSKPVLLTLTNRHVVLSAEGRELSRLWADTKRMVADVLATNRARNVIELLEAPTSTEDEQRFRQWQQGRGAAKSTDTLAMTKKKAVDNLAALEAAKRCKRSNSYQDLVNAIAQDIMMKTKRRSQRQQELTRIRQTLASLQQQSKYLGEQKQSFLDYISSCTAQLSNNKRSPKKAPLFSRQYWHARNLQKSGQMPKFGSYKFSAEDLRQKGVLLGVEGYTPKQFGGMTLIISSNEPGVFLIDCTYLGVKLADQMELRIEELLQQQNEGVQVITIFDVAKVNVNLLLFLINKRFFA